MTNSNSQDQASSDFSLVLGGPLYQLFLRAWLVRPPIDLWHRRMFFFALATWLPLLILTAFEKTLISGVRVPFLYDFGPHARFLVALPLLITAEVIVHRHLGLVLRQFHVRGLLASDQEDNFRAIMASGLRWRNSIPAEIVLLVIAFTAGHWVWQEYGVLRVNTWYASAAEQGNGLTWAGGWYEFFSLPVFRFMILRWYFRMFIWYRLLWQISRLPLRLNPLHPDRAGGLGFLAQSVHAFAPLLLAHTVLLSGAIAGHIFYEGAHLPQFKLEIAGVVAVLMVFVLLPLTFFMGTLEHARRAGLTEFGALASTYVDDFRRKWLEGPRSSEDALLGSGDIQSLADLANSFEVVRGMGVMPIGRHAVVHLFLIIVVPLLPLILTMIPLDEILERALKLVL